MKAMSLAWLGFNNSRGSLPTAFMSPSNIFAGEERLIKSLIYQRTSHDPSEFKIYRRLTRLLLSGTKTDRKKRKKEIKKDILNE